MIPWTEHRERILAAACAAARTEERALSAARGWILAADITAGAPVPPFDNSAMDGYAVRRCDAAVGARLHVVADVPAGSSLNPELAPGEAARIMTGAPVPDAADAIVPVEHALAGPAHPDHPQASSAQPLPAWIEVTAAPKEHAHIRRAGEDNPAGAVVIERGTQLGPWQLAAAASAGHSTVSVFRRPTVAVVSTGTELKTPGAPLRRGEIWESNSQLLCAAVEAARAELLTPGADPRASAGFDAAASTGVDQRKHTAHPAAQALHFDDDEHAALHSFIADVAAGRLDVDAVIFSGGASVGAFDIVKEVLTPAGVEFSRVAIQPGKPQGFGTVGRALVFGLPGNPVSVATSFEVFVRPALRVLAGAREIHRPTLTARAAVGWRTPVGRAQVMPVIVDARSPQLSVRPAAAGGSASHLVTALAQAQHLALVPAEVEQVEPGDELSVMMLS